MKHGQFIDLGNNKKDQKMEDVKEEYNNNWLIIIGKKFTKLIEF